MDPFAGETTMSNSVEALKAAIELEKKALEKYREALPHVTHTQTRESIEKYASEKNQQIDALHWMIMAEAGQLQLRKHPLRPLPWKVKVKRPRPGNAHFLAHLPIWGSIFQRWGICPKWGIWLR